MCLNGGLDDSTRHIERVSVQVLKVVDSDVDVVRMGSSVTARTDVCPHVVHREDGPLAIEAVLADRDPRARPAQEGTVERGRTLDVADREDHTVEVHELLLVSAPHSEEPSVRATMSRTIACGLFGLGASLRLRGVRD